MDSLISPSSEAISHTTNKKDAYSPEHRLVVQFMQSFLTLIEICGRFHPVQASNVCEID